ncbi:MAG: PH domain-containing protein [Microbacterium sp.]|nr:PH domain-containing protein [Microbacterium sp.]
MTEPTSPERVVARLHPHARRLAWSAVSVIAAAGAVGYFLGNMPERWMNGVLLGAAIAVLVFAGLLPFLVWAGRQYLITTRRVVVRRGLLTRVRQELLHSRGYDVTVRQSPVQRLFRSGDVLVNTGLEAPMVLRDVPSAVLVADVLQDLMEQGANPVSVRRQFEEAAASDRRRS